MLNYKGLLEREFMLRKKEKDNYWWIMGEVRFGKCISIWLVNFFEL